MLYLCRQENKIRVRMTNFMFTQNNLILSNTFYPLECNLYFFIIKWWVLTIYIKIRIQMNFSIVEPVFV